MSTLTRRQFITRSTLAGASLSIPFIHYRFAYAGEAVDPSAVKKFGAKLRGRLILPGDPQYNAARKIWNPRYDKHPAVIARCASTEDVARSVEFARKHDLAVSVRSGGHDQGGFSTNDGGVVIDLRDLREIHVDRGQRTALAGGGTHVGELYRAVAAAEMGVVSGGCHSVGIGGLTLGGGQSALSNKYGLACDNVLAMEVVTADGRIVTASEADHPDLFWALRGGSGNFGVVTKFKYRMLLISRVVVGFATYPMSQRLEVLRFFREFIATAPDELTVETEFGFPYPAGVFGVGGVYCGDARQAERVLQPLTSFGHPLERSIKTVSFIEGVSEEEPPALPNYEKSWNFSAGNDQAIEALCNHLENPPAVFQLGVFDMHGAACRSDTAYPVRQRALNSWIWGFWRSEPEREPAITWADQVASSLANYADGVYVNDLDADEGESRVRAAYGANYEKLVALKNKYDPTNFFCMNQNIKPTV